MFGLFDSFKMFFKLGLILFSLVLGMCLFVLGFLIVFKLCVSRFVLGFVWFRSSCWFCLVVLVA